MKAAELEGIALDYWVARADGRDDVAVITSRPSGTVGCWIPKDPHTVDTTPGATYFASHGWCAPYSPSTNWAQGGPLIERERITIAQYRDRIEACKNAVHGYDGLEGDNEQEGPSPLIAAMRCFVASKFGEEVPDDGDYTYRTYGTSTITDPEVKKATDDALHASIAKSLKP